MIAQLNKLIKAESKKLLLAVLYLNIFAFICLAVYVFLSRWDSAYGVWIEELLGYVLIAPFVTVCGLVTCFIRAIKPNAKKIVKRFCRKTDDPEDTFKQLEQTWEHGAVFAHNLASGRDLVIDKLPIRIDKNYLIGVIGFWIKVKIIPFENAVWIHAGKPDKETGISDTLYVYSVKDDRFRRKKYKIKPPENVDLIEGILDYIVDNCPDIAVGNYKEAKDFWKNGDTDGLKNFAKGNRSRIQETYEAKLQAGLREEKRFTKSFWYGFAQFCIMIPALVPILLAVFLGARSLDGYYTALEVLQGYERWAVVVFTISVPALLFVGIVNLVLLAKLIKSKSFKWLNIVVAAISIGVTFFVYLYTTSILDRSAIREDIYAIESNNLTTGRYWIDLTALCDELRGFIPFNDLGERVVYRQNMRGNPRPDGRWWLSGLYFTRQHNPDYLRTIAGSDEFQVREQMPDRRYFILAYTPNFRLVVDVMPTVDIDG